MSDQHRRIHWDKEEPLQGNHFHSQEVDADEWNTADYAVDPSLEPLSGKIVARMPDLGECSMISSQSSSRIAFPLRFAGRLFSVGRPVVLVLGRTLARPFSRKRKGETVVESDTTKTVASSGVSRKALYTRLITIGMILLICGVFLTAKGIKKKQKALAKKERTNVAAVQAESSPKVAKDKAAKDKAPADKKATDKAAAVKAATEKAAAAKAAAEKAAAEKAAAKAAADKAAAEKAAADKAAAAKVATAKAAADKAAADKAAADKAAAAKAAADKAAKNPNSPWDRPATDNYSPWTMTSAERLDAAAENAVKEEQNAAGVAVTSVNADKPGTATPAPAPSVAQPQTNNSLASAPLDQGVPMMNVPVTVQQASRPRGVNPSIPNVATPQGVPQTMMAGPQQDPRGFASTSQFSRGAATNPAYPGPGYAPAPAYPATAQQYPYPNPQYAPAMANYANRPAPTASTVKPAPGRIPIAESPQTYQGAPALASAAPMTPGTGYPVQPMQPVYAQTPQAFPGQPIQQPIYGPPAGLPTQPAPMQTVQTPQPVPYNNVPISHPQHALPQAGSPYQQATYQTPIPSGPAAAYPSTPFYSTYPSTSVPAYQQGTVQPVVPNGRIY